MYKINLGDVVIDIPPERKIDFGGSRSLAKYDIPGHKPSYQDMGREERTCKFNGILEGDGALSKAEGIRKLMDNGREVKFLYGEISVKALVRSFNFSYLRADRIKYDIELVQVDDLELQPMNQVQAQVAQPKGRNFDGFSGLAGLFGAISTVNHTVRQGDSLRGLSTKFFGTPHKWLSLARLNGITGSGLPEGMSFLRIPSGLGGMLELEKAIDEHIVKKRPAIRATYTGGGRGLAK